MDETLHTRRMNQSDKLALITGGARRIGKAMANHLASRGWSIAIHFNHSSKEAEEMADHLRMQYPRQLFDTFRADLGSADETEALLPAIIHKMGTPELLLNNASLFEPASLLKTSADFFDLHLSINLRAPFLLTRNFATLCRSGVIVNLIDTRVTTNKDDYAAYTLSKKALWELTKMSASALGPDIRVNGIAPGLTLPPEGKDEEYLKALSHKTALKRPGGINPVLKSLDFILDNDYLTGQLLFCDGGENLGV